MEKEFLDSVNLMVLSSLTPYGIPVAAAILGLAVTWVGNALGWNKSKKGPRPRRQKVTPRTPRNL